MIVELQNNNLNNTLHVKIHKGFLYISNNGKQSFYTIENEYDNKYLYVKHALFHKYGRGKMPNKCFVASFMKKEF